jgi:hypothetical protein
MTTEEAVPYWASISDSLVYWVVLFIAILGNFILSVVLVPFLLVLRGLGLYFSLFFIGASFGAMFWFILQSIERTQKKRIIWEIFIPALALINVGIFAVLSNDLIVLLELSTPPHNPMIVGAAYTFGYVLPSALWKIVRKKD